MLDQSGHSPLHVLFLVHNIAWKGGAFYHGMGLARHLAAIGHQVTLVAISERNRFRFQRREINGLELIESPDWLAGQGRTGWDPWDTFQRMGLCGSRSFDVLHAVDTRPAVVLPALYGRWRRKGVFIADWTDWWGRGGATMERSGRLTKAIMGSIECFFEEQFRPYADGTITISQALCQRAKALGINEETMLYLPAGSDAQRIRRLNIEKARKYLGLTGQRLRLGYLGNIYPRDAELMFNALNRVQATGVDFELVMIGQSKVAKETKSQEWLTCTGHVPFEKMVAHLCASDVLLLPMTDSIANRARWPSKINDYLACGRPIVSTRVGDLVKIFQDGDIGFLSDPNVQDFAEKIGLALRQPQSRLTAMGDEARRLAETTYSCQLWWRNWKLFITES